MDRDEWLDLEYWIFYKIFETLTVFGLVSLLLSGLQAAITLVSTKIFHWRILQANLPSKINKDSSNLKPPVGCFPCENPS
jgi:hypothetical protein